MAEAKTKPTKDRVSAFIGKVADEQRRKDCEVVLALMADVTKAKPEMWGSSILQSHPDMWSTGLTVNRSFCAWG